MDIITDRRGSVQIISLSGMLDASNFQQLDDFIQKEIQNGDRLILFDLKALEYMSSAGVRVFIRAYRNLSACGGKMVFAALQPFVQEIFEIAGLTTGFSIYSDVESGVQSLSS